MMGRGIGELIAQRYTKQYTNGYNQGHEYKCWCHYFSFIIYAALVSAVSRA